MVATVAAASRCVNSRRRCSSQSAISRRSGGVNGSSMVKTLTVTLTGRQRWHLTAASSEPALAVAVCEHKSVEHGKGETGDENRHQRPRPKGDEREAGEPEEHARHGEDGKQDGNRGAHGIANDVACYGRGGAGGGACGGSNVRRACPASGLTVLASTSPNRRATHCATV